MLFKSVTPGSASGKPWLKVFLTFCSSSIYVGRFFPSPLLLFTENQALILDNTQDTEDKHGNIFAPPTAPTTSGRSTDRSNLILKGYVSTSLLIFESELWTHIFCDISNWLKLLLGITRFQIIIFDQASF